MGKMLAGGWFHRHGIVERLYSHFWAWSATTPGPRVAERLDHIHDERVLDEVAVGRDQIRTPIGEAHWFYDQQQR